MQYLLNNINRYKMKSNKINIFALGLAAVSFASCSDFLDKTPDDRTEIDSEIKVVDLLKTSYPDANYQWLCELSSDNMIDNNTPHVPYDSDKNQKETHYNLSPYGREDDELFKFEPTITSTYNTSDSPNSFWSNTYATVASVNHALEAIDKIGGTDNAKLSAKLRAAKGEALLIRAYDHFLLVNIFSPIYKDAEASKLDKGVPYVTEVERNVHVNYSRGTVFDTYEKIEKDLLEGLSLITDDNYQMPKYHFNVNAAHAFAARFYLYKREYEKVIEHANAVLGTDPADAANMLMDYSIFTDCSYSSDFANAWQNPSLNNNLMLVTTYSILMRRALGNRYSTNSLAAREIFYHVGPTWPRWKANPTIIVGGMFARDSEYGYAPGKASEQFQYTNKVSGIGYAHTVVRAFTSTNLILERAEAKVMLGRYDDALADIIAYDTNRQTFSEADRNSFFSGGGMKEPSWDVYLPYYNPENKELKPNCFANWDFTQGVSASFVVPKEAVIYMNIINDMRRSENWMEGLRFFDLKRWGMGVKHQVGVDREIYELQPNDEKFAIEVPWEALSAGLESSHSTVSAGAPVTRATFDKDELMVK